MQRPDGQWRGERPARRPASMRAILDALNRLTRSTAQAETLEDIYTAALDAIPTALDTQLASILIVDPDGVIRFKAWRGLSHRYRRTMEEHSPWSVDTTDAQP